MDGANRPRRLAAPDIVLLACVGARKRRTGHPQVEPPRTGATPQPAAFAHRGGCVSTEDAQLSHGTTIER
ncbi:hypothetical protein [Stutzerimonas stutzeri]|uniref:Uncharacterized protein n=1 Tax=Stutzerimonas stutzeri TaxID=316 RepID=A0A0D9AHC5_STUST|nr:hypothetical protein [Stutzerimonas stutzeri]KJH80445.1 hypothetical protein UF78_15310 [Stutzerimonas stutzeri]